MEIELAKALILNSKSIYCVGQMHEALDMAVNALSKQTPAKTNAVYDNSISIGEEPNDSIYLECPICKSCIGELCDEDVDGNLKYNVYEKYCSSCGQAIEQIYTKEDYKRWGIETD